MIEVWFIHGVANAGQQLIVEPSLGFPIEKIFAYWSRKPTVESFIYDIKVTH